MKKIPTLFKRTFENHKVIDICDEVAPGCEEAFLNGFATVKYDGACCAIINGRFYKRYDAKKGKKPPAGAIPCSEPDPITGHWPHWVKIDPNNPSDKWFMEAWNYRSCGGAINLPDGTYEAIGIHFQGNPYDLKRDTLMQHGYHAGVIDVPRTFDGVKEYLKTYEVEGLVFWLDGEPVCKIKRSDFGFPWPVKKG